MNAPRLPTVWAIAPCRNRASKTLWFLGLLRQQTYDPLHTVVVDDGSTDFTTLGVRLNFPNVRILKGSGDLWWAGATNHGIRYALQQGADYILTINDDSQPPPELVSQMVQTALAHPRCIVGSVIVNETSPHTIWSVGTTFTGRLPNLFVLNFAGENTDILQTLAQPYEVDTMPGNGTLIPASAFRHAGFYNDKRMPQYHADSDFVLRARKHGYKAAIDLRTRLTNHIITAPLVHGLADVLWNKKSDLYFPAMKSLVSRHAPHISPVALYNTLYRKFGAPTYTAETAPSIT